MYTYANSQVIASPLRLSLVETNLKYLTPGGLARKSPVKTTSQPSAAQLSGADAYVILSNRYYTYW